MTKLRKYTSRGKNWICDCGRIWNRYQCCLRCGLSYEINIKFGHPLEPSEPDYTIFDKLEDALVDYDNKTEELLKNYNEENELCKVDKSFDSTEAKR